MRSRISLIALLLVVGTFALPHIASAAAIPFFGPIVPPDVQRACPAGWGAVVMVINNIIKFSITMIIVFIAPLMIAYSGFLLVVNQGDSGKLSEAKKILMNTIIGTVIALSAWLIVGALMAVLYHPGDKWGTWTELINNGGAEICVQQVATELNQTTYAGGGGQLPSATVVGTDANGNQILSFGQLHGACDASYLQSLDPNLSASVANTFACLAKPESTCGSARRNSSWDKPNSEGKASTAYGAFQVLLSTNHECFEKNVCREAAGVSGKLNCQDGFDKNGLTKGGDPAVLATCEKAAADPACNLAAAVCVLGNQPGFSAWTADSNSSVQSQCISTYSH